MNRKKHQEGMVKRHPDGFGFFIPDQSDLPDVYIPRHFMEGVMTNDRVLVEVLPERGSDRFRGEILQILSRGTKKVVGKFQPQQNGGGRIRDEGKGWGRDLRIPEKETMNATEGDLVAVEILTYPDQKEFLGKVVQVIGSHEDPLNDIERVVHSLNIPSSFSKGTLNEAAKLKPHVSEEDQKGRKKIIHLKFVTIDGATAKDFDDAVYVEQTQKGFVLYVAIADVSHYVRPGTAIDRDAVERGTSVYFPNFVIPMLPEILSNELCSLNPHLPRLALVAEMHLNFHGDVERSDFYEAVIESHARVTYGEAQEIIDGNRIEKLHHVENEIKRAADLAKILMAKRFREGSLDLEIPETQLMIDASGNPIDIIRSERLFSHRVIEEMMLAANVAVAKFLAGQEIPALYRIHEPPNPDAIALLEKYMRTFGGRIKLEEGKLQKKLTRALQEFAGRPEAQVLNILTLRSMSQAKYSANNVGHFGLGFEFYTHFTSPIRRYPDLIVHRLLKSKIMPRSAYKGIGEDELSTSGIMLSACEQRAVKAERQIQSIKKARFMQKHVGEEFDGMISSVTKFGVFVLLRQFEVDGLIHIENLGLQKFEKFEFDEENLILTSKRSGFSLRIGDPIRIRVVSADPEEGKIDFERVQVGKNETPNASRRTKRPEKVDSDVLDLDEMPLVEQNFESSPSGEKFDPGRKLEEFLKKRGLKPTVVGEGSRLGFGSGQRSHDRRSGEDRRRARSTDEESERPNHRRSQKSGSKGKESHGKNQGQRKQKGSGRGKGSFRSKGRKKR